MKLIYSFIKKPLSDELLRSALGIMVVLIFSSGLFVTSLVGEIKMKQFFSEQQLKRVLHQNFQVYAEENEIDKKFYGKIITSGSRNKKQVALTFDADMTLGMKNELTHNIYPTFYDKRIVEILRSTNSKATFFLTGMWIEQYPEESKSFAENSLFELGNHSYSHPSFFGSCFGLETIGDELKELQIKKTQELLSSLTGKANHLFRFPGGCSSDKDMALLQKEQLVSILWDVVSGDAFGQDAEHIIQKVVNDTQNGSIIVMHLNGPPTAPKTSQALPEIIKQLKEKGYEFVTVSDLLAK